MLKEFRDFALKGNVVDMAVGIVIGASFGAVVNSLVGDILMPVVGLVTGGTDFSNWLLVLKDGAPAGPYATLAAAQEAGAVTLNAGTFLNVVVTFVIVASSLFLVVKAMNAARRMQAAAPPAPVAPVAPTREEVLLTEIRDLLKRT
jgi:large conductance mechanosensitive channel